MDVNRKTKTDIFWDQRAESGIVPVDKVNIGDTVQRELETKFILANLPQEGRTLEVGCGNGHLTSVLRDRTEFVDAFDYSANMIEQAKRTKGEKNNHFFVDNILDIGRAEGPYDTVICVRVLINLANHDEQIKAIDNIVNQLRVGGRLILIEGFKDGFERLSELREASGLPPVTPASINYYSSFASIESKIKQHFRVDESFHTGTYDFLTRVVYPLLVGADSVVEAGDFHLKTLPLAESFNSEELKKFGRLRGFCLTKL